MTVKKFATTTSVALLALGLLAGCGGSDDSSDSGSSSSSSSSSGTSASSGSESSADSSAAGSSSDSSSAAPAAAAKVPNGDKLIAAPKNGISIAVPKDFVDGKNQQDLKKAADLGMDVSTIKSQAGTADMIAVSTKPDANGYTNNVNMTASGTGTASQTPDESMMKAAVGSNGKPGKYSKVSTSLGDAAQISYTVDQAGKTAHGVMIALPNAHDQLTLVAVTAGNPDDAAKLAKGVTDSAQKTK